MSALASAAWTAAVRGRMLLLVWEVRDVRSWEIVQEDSRGRRAKRWLRPPAGEAPEWSSSIGRWLFKEPRGLRPTETAIEVFALGLARRVGVPAAHGYLAEGTASNGEVRRGIVVGALVDAGRGGDDSLVDGSSLLSGTGFDPHASSATHTLTSVRAALHRLTDPRAGFQVATQLLCFDAWIGNGDRHSRNWAAIETRAGHRRFAPMFDPAACLGAELLDGTGPLADLSDRSTIDRYLDRCFSGFGNGTRRIRMGEVVDELRSTWPEWAAGVAGWLAAFRHALEHDVAGMLESCPEDWWSLERRDLAGILLTRRLEWLEGLEAGVRRG